VTAPTSSIAPGSADDFRVNVGDTVLFDTAQHSIRSDAQTVLQKQAAWLKQYPQAKLMLEGHCDERGTREYNLALGDRRAYAVKEFLVSLGVDAARLQTKSYGKERPACSESDDSCWQQNRRGYSVISAGAGS
jgi:peptidoglycan-associated lipoprotein